MSHTAHKSSDAKKEYFDSPKVLDEKTTQLAAWIKESKHFIGFTGAGISTSAGIPDFRSGKDTVLKTGPGCWQRGAQGLKKDKKHVSVPILQAIPTVTHMSFVRLMEAGYLKYLISQNIDGLHARSGIPSAQLAEVHGNTNMEWCKKCKRRYMRDFRTRNSQKVHSHETGRSCDNPACGGKLYDSIINFGENLPERELTEGFANAKKADLCLAMGSSLTVTPAADMPGEVAERGKRLVIINLQKTPLDGSAALRINGECDKVMKLVMEKLGLEVPEFALRRYVRIMKKSAEKRNYVVVEGLDSCGLPYSLFQSVEVGQGKVSVKSSRVPHKFPYDPKGGAITVTMNFFGRYGEPSFSLKIDKLVANREYLLKYSLKEKKWQAIDKSAEKEVKKEEIKDIMEDSKESVPEEVKEVSKAAPTPVIPKIESKRVEGSPLSEFEIGEKDYGSLASQKEESTATESVEA